MSQGLGVRQDSGVSLSSNHPENKWGAQHPAWHIRRLAKEREVEGLSLNYMLLYTEIMKKKKMDSDRMLLSEWLHTRSDLIPERTGYWQQATLCCACSRSDYKIFSTSPRKWFYFHSPFFFFCLYLSANFRKGHSKKGCDSARLFYPISNSLL